jgi:hypothetical protein
VRVVLVVVVVVVVVAGALVARVLRPSPRRRVLRLGRAVERVVRVVRGAAVVRWVRLRGMMNDFLLIEVVELMIDRMVVW